MAPSPATATAQRLVRESAPPRLRPAAASAPVAPAAFGVMLRACRPRQWLKNGVVALAPASGGALTRGSAVAEIFGAFVAFCLLSSATYLVNDVRDRESDRRHPRKRLRPIASGHLSPRTALRIAATLAVGGILLSLAINPALAAVAVCYLVLTGSYSLVWRDVVVADIVVVASGFLVRAAAGGAATDMRLSKSFLLVTSACALFLVAGKRYAEARESSRHPGTRLTLRRYSRSALRPVVLGAAAAGALTYAGWAFTRSTPGPWIMLSVVPFGLWLARYVALLRTGAGDAPEELILGDAPLLLAAASWTILFLIGLYGAR